jgi:nitrogen fixation protein NifU and related proteins
MNLNDPQLMRSIIMDHYQYPRNRRECHDHDCKSVHMNSESCIDDIMVYVKLDHDVIKDFSFTGQACTISTASTSILSELVKGKTLSEAKEIISEYRKMVNLESYNAETLEEAVAFSNIGKQANRIKCALIGWDALSQIIAESEE